MSYFVYMLRCADDTLYIGSTSDVKRRLAEHQNGWKPRAYTISRRPVRLVWQRTFETRQDAQAAEKVMKKWPRHKKEALIVSDPSAPSFAVLWDFDGVLADTNEYHFQSWKEILAEIGISFSRQDFQSLFGMSNSQTSRIILGLEQDTQQSLEVSDRKEALYRQMLRGRITMNPNLASVLESLKRAGVKMAIASSAPPENLEVVLAELGIASYFQAIVSGDSLPSKPDPAVFLVAADLIGAPPESCIVVEDSPHGIEAARRAGMKCIAVASTQPVEKLVGADRIIDGVDVLKVEDFLELV